MIMTMMRLTMMRGGWLRVHHRLLMLLTIHSRPWYNLKEDVNDSQGPISIQYWNLNRIWNRYLRELLGWCNSIEILVSPFNIVEKDILGQLLKGHAPNGPKYPSQYNIN